MNPQDILKYIRIRRLTWAQMTDADWAELERLRMSLPDSFRMAVNNAGGRLITEDSIDKLLIRFLAGEFNERSKQNGRLDSATLQIAPQARVFRPANNRARGRA